MRNRDVEVYRITNVQPGPTAEQLRRERTYLLMMGTRMVAIVVAVLVPGVWRWVAIAAGVLLPYVAVVLVNAVHTREAEPPPAPFVPDHKTAVSDLPYQGPRDPV